MQSNINRKFTWFIQKIINGDIVKRSENYWSKNKGQFSGQRGFVIGNGPSLNSADLTKLKNEITIASNKIYLIFDKTSWRPTLFTIADRILWKKIKNEVYNHFNEVIISSSLFNIPRKDKTIFFRNLGYSESMHAFSPNIIEGVFGSRTVTYINIQIAVHLGLNPIYLIGCDHYYKNEENVTEKNRVTEHHGESNHFVPNYREEGEKVNYAPIDIMTKGYEKAKKYCDNNNIRIFNATRGGYLEVFERVNFDKLFN